MSPDWRAAWPYRPSLPDAPDPGATEVERAAYLVAHATYTRSVRVYDVARLISREAYISRSRFADPHVPLDARTPEYYVLDIADAAIQLADDYAPGAPEGLRNEAAIRAGGWLRDVDPAASQVSRAREEGNAYGRESSTTAVSYRPAAAGALRASGGMALLSRYRVRRAGAIEPSR